MGSVLPRDASLSDSYTYDCLFSDLLEDTNVAYICNEIVSIKNVFEFVVVVVAR